MSHEPKVLVASHPTRGVDVGAQASIWDIIRQARRDGLAVLLISADLEELIGLSDTIEVLLRGRLTGTFDPDTVTAEDLGAAMTGAASTAGHHVATSGEEAPGDGEPSSEDDTPTDPAGDVEESR